MNQPDPITEYLARYPVVGPAEVAALFGVIRQRAYQITQTGDFPQPIAVLAKGGVWNTGDVLAYAARHKRTVTLPTIVTATPVAIELIQTEATP